MKTVFIDDMYIVEYIFSFFEEWSFILSWMEGTLYILSVPFFHLLPIKYLKCMYVDNIVADAFTNLLSLEYLYMFFNFELSRWL